ncbi:MAG: hypothetical protein DRP64_05520 [Verrucomicrobia bacterium]|nr:MAG: hypothetical protein DRP64_05520 [Verrucomicrobiota bacterium]
MDPKLVEHWRRSSGADVFEISGKGGKVSVKGSGGVALCRGSYEYLKETCNVLVSWNARNVEIPAKLSDRRLHARLAFSSTENVFPRCAQVKRSQDEPCVVSLHRPKGGKRSRRRSLTS